MEGGLTRIAQPSRSGRCAEKVERNDVAVVPPIACLKPKPLKSTIHWEWGGVRGVIAGCERWQLHAKTTISVSKTHTQLVSSHALGSPGVLKGVRHVAHGVCGLILLGAGSAGVH